jgi:hypothetical protein
MPTIPYKPILPPAILTLVLHSVILFGVSHALTFLGLFELVVPFELADGNTKPGLLGDSENRQFTAALIALLGKALLLAAMLKNHSPGRCRLVYTALALLFLAYALLSIDFKYHTIDQLPLLSGIPFIGSAIWLFWANRRNHQQMRPQRQEIDD